MVNWSKSLHSGKKLHLWGPKLLKIHHVNSSMAIYKWIYCTGRAMPYNILLKASAKVRAGSNTFGLRKLGKIIKTCLEFIILSGEQLKGTSEAAMTKIKFSFLSFLFFHGCTQYFKSCYDSVHLESIHQQQFPCPRIHFL